MSSLEPAVSSASHYLTTDRLIDGREIVIRAIRPDDKPLLLQHFNSLSQRAIYYRFCGFKHTLTTTDLKNLTELDFDRSAGLAATLGRGSDETFIGVGRYVRADAAARAEIAFAVLDSYQGLGIATLLLQHLIKLAQPAGITQFTADVLASNQRMLEVFAHSGFPVEYYNQAGAVRVVIDIGTAPPS
jgi:GNAT superfamily N-acetyltransferase